MDMVVHEAEGEAVPSVSPHRLPEQDQVDRSVMVVEIDVLLRIAPGVHVMDGAREVFARLARHTLRRRSPPLFAPEGGQTPLGPGGSDPLMRAEEIARPGQALL